MKKDEKKTMKMRSGWVAGLVALAVIGGVYASWNYTTYQTADSKTSDGEILLVEAKPGYTPHGEIAITSSTPMTVSLDDTGDHTAKIVMGGGPINFTFTGTEGSEYVGGIPIKYSVAIAGTKLQWEGHDVLTANSALQQYDSGAATKTGSITTEMIGALLTPNLSLPTYGKYQEFEELFNTNKSSGSPMKIVVTISDGLEE